MEAYTQNHHGWMDRILDDYHFLVQIADYNLASGRYEQARQDYTTASILEPLNPRPLIGLGVLALRTNDHAKALRSFEAACRLDPTCSRAFCGLAVVHHLQARPDMAAGMYRRCLELDGDNLTALLGLLEIAKGMRHFRTVAGFLQQYTARHPDDIAVRLCLAAVCLNEEKLGAARDVLLEILAMDPENPTASALMEELNHIFVNTEIERARQMYLVPSY